MAAATFLQSTLTCPDCGHVKTETMPTDACQWFYQCEGCKQFRMSSEVPAAIAPKSPPLSLAAKHSSVILANKS